MIRKSSNKDISSLNTFRMKVKAALYLEYDYPEDLLKIDWNALPRPVVQIGSGSNLLFTGDFPGTLVHSNVDGIDVVESRSSGNDVFVHVGAGIEMDELCHWAALKGLWGPENLSGIPGSVGASAVQNVGAYGVEAGDIIDSVECFDIQEGKFVLLSAADCAFAYRDSYFKHHRGRYAITGVVFRFSGEFMPRLDYGNLRSEVERNVELSTPASDPYNILFAGSPGRTMPLTPMLVRNTVRVIREAKLPDPKKTGSAGSFFKNPVVPADVFAGVEAAAVKLSVADGGPSEVEVPHFELPGAMVKVPAAWLIDRCALKGSRIGGAAVWEKQPLVIVNATGKATPEDVLALEKKIVDTVHDTFGITLSPEVDHI